ncbi:hypothetical protein FD723_40170 (plasmid) [Nostoc sp. C052]|uniref:hypothetical protein n=1 Tax=Nostoc sp. C052 TaxID=2576902 RepID=UPI0015C3BEBF|nr:hypothetical protein [Nostoc sp. C052]QLE46430.1 hypothetical protein FD723_40170 [Nostoc sp. C052]
MIEFPVRDNYSLDEFFDYANFSKGFQEQEWGVVLATPHSPVCPFCKSANIQIVDTNALPWLCLSCQSGFYRGI